MASDGVGVSQSSPLSETWITGARERARASSTVARIDREGIAGKNASSAHGASAWLSRETR